MPETGLSFLQRDLTVLASIDAMSRVFRDSEYACTSEKKPDALLDSDSRFSLICRHLRKTDGLNLKSVLTTMLKNNVHARVGVVEVKIPRLREKKTRLVVKTTDDTLGVSDRSPSEYGEKIKMFKDRAVSVACVNFLSFSRGVQDYWVASYGDFSCSNKKWKKRVNLKDSGTSCSAQDRSPTMVTVQDFVDDAVSIGDWCENLRRHGADAADLRVVLAMLFLNMQIAKESCGFEHADLHLENVLVRESARAEVHSILYASDVYTFRTRFSPVIIDYDMSMSCLPYRMGSTLTGRKNEEEFFFGDFTLPGVDPVALLVGVLDETMHMDDRRGFPFREMVRDALGQDALREYSGDDALVRFVTSTRGGITPRKERDALARAEYLCGELNEFILMHPIDFALRLIPGCGKMARVSPARDYAPPRFLPPSRSSIDFWREERTLEALREIAELSGNDGKRYLSDCLEDLHGVSSAFTMGNLLAEEIGSSRKPHKRHSVVGAGVSEPMSNWDRYFLVRYLQLDAQCCPGLLDFLEDVHFELSSLALDVSTKQHVAAFKRAWDVLMYQRYTLSFDSIQID